MDFYNKALSVFPEMSTQIVPTQITTNYVNVKTKNNQLIRKRNTYKTLAQNKDLVHQQPASAVPANWLEGSQIDFRIESGIVDALDWVCLRAKYTNSTGGAVVLAPHQMHIQRIDVYAQNGSDLIYSVQGHDLYLANAFIPRNEYENISGLMGLTESYASAATSITDGTSLYSYIPLFSPWLCWRIHPSGLKGNLLVRVYSNVKALTTVSGGTLTCNELVLQLYSRDQPQSLQTQQNNFYMDPSIPTSLSFLSIQRMPYPITLAASSQYDIVLTGIRGIASCLFFTLRAAAVTASNCITYTAIDTYDIVDASGNSLLGSTQKNSQEQQMEYATCFNNKFRKLINFNFVPFSSDPVSDYTMGTGNGFQPFTSFERLQFKTPSGLSPGAYLLDIVAFVQDDLVIKSGYAKSTGMN